MLHISGYNPEKERHTERLLIWTTDTNLVVYENMRMKIFCLDILTAFSNGRVRVELFYLFQEEVSE
jgi:hypothetical protein